MIRVLYVIAALGALVIGVTLWVFGQPLICACGYIKPWEGMIWSPGNSQHFADWYTLSHVVHGMLIILLGRIAGGRIPYAVLVILAIVTGMAWEIVEHTDWVLNQFRSVTIYQGYLGDSVLNSVADYVWMWVGFFVARALSTLWVLLLILVLEVTSALIGRDCLTFTTIQLVWPQQWIADYQAVLNPNAQPSN